MSTDQPIQLATVFTQPGCAESARVRSWLIDRGVTFTERDAGHDPAAAHLAATGLFATPLLVVGQTQLLGYQPAVMARMFQRDSAAESR